MNGTKWSKMGGEKLNGVRGDDGEANASGKGGRFLLRAWNESNVKEAWF